MFEFFQKLSETEMCRPEAGDPVIVLCRREVLIAVSGGFHDLPRWGMVREILPAESRVICLGTLDGSRCFAAEAASLPVLPEEVRLIAIRRFLFEFPADMQAALCRARELLAWRGNHRFCGVCRAELTASSRDSGLVCPRCGAVYYPQLAPAVIVGITRGGGRELLLAHNRGFADGVYSLIAGFVEAGENLEAAIRREIREECAVEVGDLRYVTSQVWPFPNSLMLAFRAEYRSGEARPDGEELSDLGWFTAEDHPALPAEGSVARRVIDGIFRGEIS